MAKSLGGSSFKRKATSTSTVLITPFISNYEPNYQEGYNQELDDYAQEEEEEEEEEKEPMTPIGITRSWQSSTRLQEV